MLFSYKWLQEYFEDDLPEAKDLAGTLNTRAFEVEEVTEHKDDFIIDIDIQPNRAHDCFSHYGVAKEISVLTGLKLKEENINEDVKDFESDLVIEINHKKCLRYIGKEIRGVEVKDSPDFVKEKLEALGQRSINNIVDFTNLVMFEIGQPMHAFDKDKLDGNKISVRSANPNEKLTTLDGKEVTFDKGDLVKAIRASISVPIVFKPVKYRDYLLSDGGLSNPLPNNIAREMGANIIVSVNLDNDNFGKLSTRNMSIQNVSMRSLNIMKHHLSKRCIEDDDIIIEPNVDEIGLIGWDKFFSKKETEKMIKQGETAANKYIEEIKKRLRV